MVVREERAGVMIDVTCRFASRVAVQLWTGSRWNFKLAESREFSGLDSNAVEKVKWLTAATLR